MRHLNHRKIKTIITAGFLSSLLCFSAYGRDYSTNTIGDFTFGTVNLDMTTEDLGNYDIVYPGTRIHKNIEIKNNGNSAWIRLKFTTKGIEELNENNLITIENDDWIKIGDYFYRKNPVKEKETLSINYCLTIPGSLDNTVSKEKFDLIVRLDAIQEANFNPDFSSYNPWYGTEITASTNDEEISKEVIKENYTISFIGGAEKFVKPDKEFFDIFEYLMPGDNITKILNFENNYRRDARFYIKPIFSGNEYLLNNIFITLYAGDKEIYNGTLKDMSGRKIYVGNVLKEEIKELKCNIKVPAEIGNEYALNTIHTDWTLIANLTETGNGPSGNNGSNSSGGGSNSENDKTGPGETDANNENDPFNKPSDETTKPTPDPTENNPDNVIPETNPTNEPNHTKKNEGLVKTGDNMMDIKLFGATAISGILAFSFYIIEKRNNKNEKKHSN